MPPPFVLWLNLLFLAASRMKKSRYALLAILSAYLSRGLRL
jgi:hypothetical protein